MLQFKNRKNRNHGMIRKK